MRALLFASGLGALLLTGCDRLQDDPIYIYGRTLLRDGSPVPNATLAYDRALHPVLGGIILNDTTTSEFFPYGTTLTEANGDYFLDPQYGDVEQVLNEETQEKQPYRFRVPLVEENGGSVFVSFVLHDDVEVPELRPWDSGLAVEDGAEGPVVSFGAVPPIPPVPVTGEILKTYPPGGGIVEEVPSTPEPVLNLYSGGQLMYRWWNPPSPVTLSPYVLEDFPAPEARLRAHTIGEWWFHPLASIDSSVMFRVEWRTEAVAVPAGSLRPVSRGASCNPSPTPVCPWTDGRLDEVTLPSQGRQPIVITLEQPQRLRHAVIRGLHNTTGVGGGVMALEGSADGEHWSLLVNSREEASGSPGPRGFRGMFEDLTNWDSPLDVHLSRTGGPFSREVALADVGPVLYVRFTFGQFVISESQGQSLPEVRLAELSLFE